jgi:hypothetical protein
VMFSARVPPLAGSASKSALISRGSISPQRRNAALPER